MTIDVSGVWKIKEACLLDSDLNEVWRTVEDIMADDSIEDKALYNSVAVFRDDGELCMAMPIPDDMSEEEIKELVEEEGFERCGKDYLIYEKYPWKEEDGKILYDSGARGEVLGEEISPWEEITGTGGEIIFSSYKLVKL